MWLDNASKLDMLFYKPYADLVNEILEDENYNPLTIGIFGAWGAGKSTLLNMIKDSINNENIECIEINAWMFEGYEDAKTAIMESLLKTMESNQKIKDKVSKEIKGLLKRVNWLKLGSKAISYGVPLIASLGLGNPIPSLLNVANDITSDKDKLADTIKNAANGIEDIRENYLNEEEKSTVENIRQFRKDFQDMLKKTEINNLVVLIDDLDRCNPDRIIETLEAIKLFLLVENTTFIVAADENVIQYSIKKKYPKTNNSEPDISKEYIEKIIQLPIYIPELSSKDIENYLMLLVAQKYLEEDSFKELLDIVYTENILIDENKITLQKINQLIGKTSQKYKNKKEFDKDIEIIENIKNIVAITLKGNPRQAKRFLNTFIIKKKLAECYYGDEINIKILAKLLVLQKIDNKLFKELNEWNKSFKTQNDIFSKLLETAENDTIKDEFPNWDLPQVRKWIECEPKNIHTERLDKYFYLTRELLNNSIIDDSILDSETRTILEKIGKSSRHTIKTIMDEMGQLSSEQIKNIFDILLSEIKEGKLEFYIINVLYEKFTTYRKLIMEQITAGSYNINAPDVIYLASMYKLDKSLAESYLKKLKDDDKINEKMFEMIKGGK